MMIFLKKRIILILFITSILVLAGCSSLLKNVNSEFCEKLSLKGKPVNELDSCYILAAVNEKNSNLCEKISRQTGEYDSKDACYSNLAEILKDDSLCEKIQTIQVESGVGTRDTCYHNLAPVLNKVELCNKIQQKNELVYKDACFSNVALENSRPEVCNLINSQSNEDVNIASKDNCFGSLGILMKDKSLCEKAGIFKEECLERT